MDIFSIPFVSKLGVQISNKEGYQFKLDYTEDNFNHLNTTHAAALFGLAETCAGQFLLNQFPEIAPKVIAVVRKADIKYSKPALETIHAKAQFHTENQADIENNLVSRRKAIIAVRVDVHTESSERVLTAVFEWFVSFIKEKD